MMVLMKAACLVWTKLAIRLQIRVLIKKKKMIMKFLLISCSEVFKNGTKIGFTSTPNMTGFSLTARIA